MATSSAPKIVRQGEGERLELRGELRHQLLDGNDTVGSIALARSQFQPGSGAPLHLHTREDELFLIESGEFAFQVGDEKLRLRAGDFVFGPRLVPHAYTCESEEGGSLFVAVVGAGFESFFRDMAAQVTQGNSLGPTEMVAVAATYGVEIGKSVSAARPDASPVVVRAGEGELLHAFGDKVRVLLQTELANGLLCVGELETPPHGGPPLHLHEREDEFFLIRAGRFHFRVADQQVEVGVGDVVFAPRGIPHTYSAISDEPGAFLLLATPGGFDNFFRDAAGLFQSGDVTPQSVGELGDKYGIRFMPSE